jgi:NADPH:quinone reductase-like Zn-dependent oxidoreductase
MSRAAVVEAYGGVELIKVQPRPTPTPAPGELLIEVRAAGVNLVDTMLRAGYLETGPLPLTLGSDFAGVVADASDLEGFAIGDEVYGYKLLGNGTYAEYAAIDASLLARKPPSLSFAEAGALPCAGLVAYDAIVNTLALQPDETS